MPGTSCMPRNQRLDNPETKDRTKYNFQNITKEMKLFLMILCYTHDRCLGQFSSERHPATGGSRYMDLYPNVRWSQENPTEMREEGLQDPKRSRTL